MKTDELFEALWSQYTEMTPSAEKIRQCFNELGETVINDHIAFRTFNDPRVNIEVLAKPFKNLGYVEKGSYEFKEKKLFAHHYELPDSPEAPKIFISELLLEQCSAEVRKIIAQILEKIPVEMQNHDTLLMAGRWWKLAFKDYESLRKESEYASWMYVFGFCANHFTVLVNKLKTMTTLQQVNDFLKEKGFRLNNAGGEIKGTPEQLLEQSSTLADQVEVDFDEGIKTVPGCYYEFARRYPKNNGQLYSGFIAASADKIFESTNVSLAEKILSKRI